MTETVGESIAHGFLTGRLTMTPWTAIPDATTDTVIRSEQYSIRFDSPRQEQAYAGMAGAIRFVWNAFLADHVARYRLRKANLLGPQLAPLFFTLDKRALALRTGTSLRRAKRRRPKVSVGLLGGLPAVQAKYLADAYTPYFQAKKEAEARGEKLSIRKADGHTLTFPRRNSKQQTVDGFTIPQAMPLPSIRLPSLSLGF